MRGDAVVGAALGFMFAVALVLSCTAPAKAGTAPSCPSQAEVLQAAEPLGRARGIHQQWADKGDANIERPDLVGDVAWHTQWIVDYDKALAMYARLTQACK